MHLRRPLRLARAAPAAAAAAAAPAAASPLRLLVLRSQCRSLLTRARAPRAPSSDGEGHVSDAAHSGERQSRGSSSSNGRRRRKRADDDDANENDADAASTSSAARLLRRAVRLVDYRERSSGELVRRLMREDAPEAAARAAVERLTAAGLVDDARFAQLFVERRWRGRAEAPGAIRRALLAAGVPPEVGEEALAAFFGPDVRVLRPPPGGIGAENEDEEEEDSDANADESGARARWRALVAAAREQARRSESLADLEKRRARLSRWLAARGHCWDTVSAVMREVGL